MIQITNVKVYGLDESVIASGYPMRTDLPNMMWICDQPLSMCSKEEKEKHTKRARYLASADIGEGHDNFLNGIIVQFDLTAPIKVWTEAQRYHFLDFVSSQSTMHRLAKMNLAADATYDEHVDVYTKTHMAHLKDVYNGYANEASRIKQEKGSDSEEYEDAMKAVRDAWFTLIMCCPVGLLLTARMTTNYRQLKTIYHQRKNHRLPHWHQICEWIERLPLSEMLGVSKSEG